MKRKECVPFLEMSSSVSLSMLAIWAGNLMRSFSLIVSTLRLISCWKNSYRSRQSKQQQTNKQTGYSQEADP